MNTGKYFSPDDIIFMASAMVADRDYKVLPKGFYVSLIQKAFEELAMDTFFQELRANIEFPSDNLTASLPEDCFNVKNVYLFSGDECNINTSVKVYWKRNYFTTGNGFIANDKGNNRDDPFYDNHDLGNRYGNRGLMRGIDQNPLNRYFYNIQMGNIMFSSSCRGVANKVHLHYNGAGVAIGEEPIIPVFLRTAMEDYVIESALRFRMANDPDARNRWTSLWSIYNKRLRDPYDGSWANAEYRVKTLNESQRTELYEYLSRGGWGSGM